MEDAEKQEREKSLKKIASKELDVLASQAYAQKLEREERRRAGELQRIKDKSKNNLMGKVHRVERVNEEKLNAMI